MWVKFIKTGFRAGGGGNKGDVKNIDPIIARGLIADGYCKETSDPGAKKSDTKKG
jgi:hypothetical protein